MKTKRNKKEESIPQAMFLDNPEGGNLEIRLLYARIETLKKDGEAAMSPGDLRNGYTPDGVVRMMTRQLVQFLKGRQATLEPGEKWVDRRGAPRPQYLLRDELTHLQRELETMDTTMSKQTTLEPEKQPPALPKGQEKTTPPGGALERLEKASEIRRAIFLLRAQLKEIRKMAKDKITILERAQSSLLDDLDPKQMTLFDISSISEEAQAILDDPSL